MGEVIALDKVVDLQVKAIDKVVLQDMAVEALHMEVMALHKVEVVANARLGKLLIKMMMVL